MTNWFSHCYRVEVDPASGRAEWRMFALPAAGGIGEQDARLMHGLRECARVGNELLALDVREAARDRERKRESKRG